MNSGHMGEAQVDCLAWLLYFPLTLDMPAGSLPLPMYRRKGKDVMVMGGGEKKTEGEIGKREGQERRGAT